MSVSTLMMAAVLSLILFLGFLNFAFWRVERQDSTPLWLAAWLTASAVFALCRLLQFADLSESLYNIIPRLLLAAAYSLGWLGYELANTFIGYRPPPWERILILIIVTAPIILLGSSNWILTDQIVIRTGLFGETYHGLVTGGLYVPINFLFLIITFIPFYRLAQARDFHKGERLLMAAGFLCISLFSINDILTIFFNLTWIRLTDFSHLPMPILFSTIQVHRFGRLYKEMNGVVQERTKALRQTNEALRAEIGERKEIHESLQESESRYRMLFEANPHPMWVYDIDTLAFLLVNDAAVVHYGYSREEFFHKTILDIRPLDEIPALMDNLKQERQPFELSGPWKHRKKDGTVIFVEISSHGLVFKGKPARLVSVNDITERMRAEEEIRRKVDETTALYETTRDLVIEQDLTKLLHTIVERAAALVGASGGGLYLNDPEKRQIRCVVSYNTGRDYTGTVLRYGEGAAGTVAETGKPLIIDDYRAWDRRAAVYEQDRPFVSVLSVPMLWQEQVIGVIHVLEGSKARQFTNQELQIVNLFANQAAIAVANAKLLSELQEALTTQSRLFQASVSITSQLELEVLLKNIVTTVRDAIGADQGNVMLIDERGYCYKWIGSGYPNELEPHFVRPEGKSIQVMRSGEAGFFPEFKESLEIELQEMEAGIQSAACLSLNGKSGSFGVMWVNFRAPHEFSQKDRETLETFSSQAAIAIENARLFEAEQRRRQEAAAIAEVGRDISSSLQLSVVLERIASHAKDLLKAVTSAVYLSEPGKPTLRAIAAIGPDEDEIKEDPLNIGEGILGNIILHKAGEIVNNTAEDSRALIIKGTDRELYEHLMGVPVISKDQLVGLIAVWRMGIGNEFNSTDLDFLTNLAGQVAVAIENARLFESTRQRLMEIEAVHTVSTALRSAQTLHEALPIILDQLMSLLNAGGASLEMVDPLNGEIVTELAHGAWVPVTGLRTPKGEGISGLVVATGQPYVSADVLADGKAVRPDLFAGLQRVACVPVIAQHQPIGALWVGRKTPILKEEVSLLAAIGEMVGNAIQRMRLHEQLEHLLEDVQVANRELSQAYDTTLEGWAKALELRDKETEGHSRRVTDLTLRLATQLGIAEPALTHIRRGVLLHDIGKMGIPDQLLKKTGPLTEEEWCEMRKHPQYAYDLIYPIAYLRASLDIPYCHHEKWDGSGYPRGLKGEEIPLAARIFAIADVYDALSYDRPYRFAWSRQDVLDYLREGSGGHFDPKVVDAFFQLIEF